MDKKAKMKQIYVLFFDIILSSNRQTSGQTSAFSHPRPGRLAYTGGEVDSWRLLLGGQASEDQEQVRDHLLLQRGHQCRRQELFSQHHPGGGYSIVYIDGKSV